MLFPSINKRLILLVMLDATTIVLSLILSFSIYFSNISLVWRYLVTLWWLLPLDLIIRFGTFRNFGLYHWVWHYASVREFVDLAKAVTLSSVILWIFIFLLDKISFPFSILVIDWMLLFILLSGSRLAIRIIRDIKNKTKIKKNAENRILVVGAGDAGEMIVREMLKNIQLGYLPIGFVDDDFKKRGQYIHQLPVLGLTREIPDLVNKYDIDEIIIAIPSASGNIIRQIVDYCEESKVKFKTVPGVYELIDGTVSVNQIRDVEIEDLLGREPVKVDLKEISGYISGARVLVTGAGGSIGSELCRQIAAFEPSELILFGRGENSIYHIELELKQKFPYLLIRPVIGDVRNIFKVEDVFKKFNPKVVFHAAAHKHVPLMEMNPDEAIINNVIGTKIVADVAEKYEANEFIMISTDKAVNPTSIMGASKRIAELIIQSKFVSGAKTKFVSVRFGNVLESRGSVIPLFKSQIARGGPVTVTHPDVKRYFMTIPEAVQLVIQAGAMGRGGEIFVLDMGEPVKILNLAQDLIRLSGLEVGKDIEIQFVGLRPGEKMFEEILTNEEGIKATTHKKIFIGYPEEIDVSKLYNDVSDLEKLAVSADSIGIRRRLKEMRSDFRGL